MKKITTLTDIFINCTSDSDVQSRAIANNIKKGFVLKIVNGLGGRSVLKALEDVETALAADTGDYEGLMKALSSQIKSYEKE